MPRGRGGGAARGAGGGRGRKPKAANGYQLSSRLTEGTVLTDLNKKEWKVGSPIGQGGFGVLYLADTNSPKPVSANAPYVLKMEPQSNGPLFCEVHFYQRAAKAEMIKEWLTSNKLKHVGVPKFIALGFYESNGAKNRFLLMERFGTDLQKKFEENGKVFPRKLICQLAIKVLSSLEYIHSKDYTHADIKAANLLTGCGKDSDKIYLVDYGLASRYLPDGKHKEYKEDPRKAHDGTIEFTSRDAHLGVDPSRRADIEILGYCLLQWHCSVLPWEDNLLNKNYVKDQKIKFMDNIPLLMSTCFKGKQVPSEIKDYFVYINTLEYSDKPDYNYLRKLFHNTLSSLGGKESDKLDFTVGSPKRKGAPQSPMASPVPAKRGRPTPNKVASPVTTPGRGRKAPTKTPTASPSLGRRGRATPRKTPATASNGTNDIDPLPAKPKVTRTPKRKLTESMDGPAPTRRRYQVKSAGTQTSPGLKGLKAMRKARK